MLGARGSFQDRYEKIKLLGEGAFGAAYLVRPKDERHLQVAKEIRISHLTDKQREGAIAESEVLRMLKHPNIIAYINSFLEGPRMYIIMEYANGGDLGIKIKERKDTNAQFEEWEIMRIFVQLVLALTHIHARKVLHRDLKPLNVFLTLQGIVKLGDFGIARLLDSTTDGAQTTIGTPHYLSPEIVNNEAYGTRSDLWSLGVVTYELAALRVPFSGNSLPAVAMKIMGADPEPLPHRSSELNVIVFGLLSKDPAERPSLKELQNRPYVANYAKELLHYSRETGTGGCEGMTRSLEAKELVYDREDEPARPRKPGRPQDKEVYSDQGQVEAPADGQMFGAWMQCQTPEGQVYYYNQQTGETSWDLPAQAQAQQAQQAYNPFAQAEEAARLQRQQYEDALRSMQQAEEQARQQREQ